MPWLLRWAFLTGGVAVCVCAEPLPSFDGFSSFRQLRLEASRFLASLISRGSDLRGYQEGRLAPTAAVSGGRRGFGDSRASFKTIPKGTLRPQLRQEHERACNLMIDKVLKMLRFTLEKKVATGTNLSQAELMAFADLDMYQTGDSARELIQNTLSVISLGTALQAGELWTQDDQEVMLNTCYEKDPFDKLEEHVATEAGETLVQGDVVLDRFIGPSPGKPTSLLMRRDHSEHVLQPQQESRWMPKLWAKGRVVYCFQEGISALAKQALKSAMEHVELQVPCIRFQEVDYSTATSICTTRHPAIVAKSDEPGCWSSLGSARKYERNTLNLGMGCELMGFALHQLGHVLGMVHTHSRADRDSYIDIKEDNADKVRFDINFASNDDILLQKTFDFLSIMFGSYRAFSANGKPTIEGRPSQLLERFIGQRMSLSQGDVEQLGAMYGCSGSIRPSSLTRELNYKLLLGQGVVTDGSCVDAAHTNMLIMPAGTSSLLRNLSCSELQDACSDHEYTQRVRQTCPNTCLMCVPLAPAVHEASAYDAVQFSDWLSQYSNYTAKISGLKHGMNQHDIYRNSH